MTRRTAMVFAAALPRYGGYPMILVGTLLAAWFLLGSEAGITLGAGLPLLGCGLLVWLLEWPLPYTVRWRASRQGATTDLIHNAVSAGVAAPLVRATVLALAATAGAFVTTRLGGSLWPGRWPPVAQLMLAVFIADFGAYWAHRLMHMTDWGWRIHCVHHSVEQLHVLAAGRSHPFNSLLTLTAEGVPLIFLGISPEIMALFMVYKGTNGFLQHSNVDFHSGILSAVLATADVHRWHHSRVLEESNTNFGNTLVLWDRLFGTYVLPDRPPPTDVGIADTVIPENYWAHLKAPFVLSTFEEG
jgi:ornithine lipid hydroxylase